MDEWTKRVRDIVNKGIGNPVGGDRDVVSQLLDPAANVLRMRRGSEVKGKDTLTEDNDVHIERFEMGGAVRVLVKGSEADQIIISEEFDFFASFLHKDIFSCEWMDGEDLQRKSVTGRCSSGQMKNIPCLTSSFLHRLVTKRPTTRY